MISTANLYGGSGHPWERKQTDVYRLLSDSKFESLVSDRWLNSQVALVSVQSTRNLLDRIQNLIAAEMGESP